MAPSFMTIYLHHEAAKINTHLSAVTDSLAFLCNAISDLRLTIKFLFMHGQSYRKSSHMFGGL